MAPTNNVATTFMVGLEQGAYLLGGCGETDFQLSDPGEGASQEHFWKPPVVGLSGAGGET